MSTEPSNKPIRKVVAATAGAGIGGATAGLIDGLLGDLIYHGDSPGYVSTFVVVVVPAAVAFLGGYFTKRAPGEG